ncbi:hypothetical protein HELRODRAFT_178834 [Helobdella robusta]|uniref:Uncharacterized protein n=1 Tax=Helobdella robusta TaxID=6412 RepID=T1FDT2_HELRO|nr:hypothetical protein HELRODRAFT_178834 [Helobdella robusta]ESN95917.1 hypothetical protein HELRODRAFT_178834 [Helobdella robusta]
MAAAKRRHVYQTSKDSKTLLGDENEDDELFLINDDDDFFDVEPVVLTKQHVAQPRRQHCDHHQQLEQHLQQQQQQQQFVLQQKLLQQQRHAIVMQQLKQQQLQKHCQQIHNQHIKQHHYQAYLYNKQHLPHQQQLFQQNFQQQFQQPQQETDMAQQRQTSNNYLPHQQSSPIRSAPTLTTACAEFPSPTTNSRRFSQQITGHSVSSWRNTFQQLSRDLQIICSSSSRESLNFINSRPNSPNSSLVFMNSRPSSFKHASSTSVNSGDVFLDGSQLASHDTPEFRRISMSSVQFDDETQKLFNCSVAGCANNITKCGDAIETNSSSRNLHATNNTARAFDNSTPTETSFSNSHIQQNGSEDSAVDENIVKTSKFFIPTTQSVSSDIQTNPLKPIKTTTFSSVLIVPDTPDSCDPYETNIFAIESDITSLGFSDNQMTKIKVRHEETEVSLNRTLALICRSNNSSPKISRMGKFEIENDNDYQVDEESDLDGFAKKTDNEKERKRRISLESRLKNFRQTTCPLQQEEKVDVQNQVSIMSDTTHNRLSLDSSMQTIFDGKKLCEISKKSSLENNLLRFKLELNETNPYMIGVSVDEENGFLTIFETVCANNFDEVSDETSASNEDENMDAGENALDDSDSGIIDLSESLNRNNKNLKKLEKTPFDDTKNQIKATNDKSVHTGISSHSSNSTSSSDSNASNESNKSSSSFTSGNTSSGFEDVDTMLATSPLSNSEHAACLVDGKLKQNEKKNPLKKHVSNNSCKLGENENGANILPNSSTSNNSVSTQINSSASAAATTTNQLHLLRICEMTSIECLCCSVENNALYIRERHHENEFLSFEGIQMKYLPIINEDLVNCKVVITLFVPEQVRDNVQVKTIDNILVLSAGHIQQSGQLPIPKVPSPPSSPTNSSSFSSSSSSFSSSKLPSFRVALTLPPETVTRSIEAWMSHGGQLVVRGDTVIGGRRMTCTF